MKINPKSQISNLKPGFACGQTGFTLIELLVVVGILSIVGSIVAGIITYSLRGTNKASTIENIRQSGNYAISQMAKTIEYAETFDGLSMDGIDYKKSCPVIQPTPNPTFTPYSYIKVTPFNSSTIVYSCSFVGGTATLAFQQPPTAPAVSLIDTSSIEVVTCSFTCEISNTLGIPSIMIELRLKPAISSTLVENVTPFIRFDTEVTMRNYQR